MDATTTVVTKEEILADERYLFLSVLLTSDYYLELMEQLKETNVYSGYLRNGAKLVAEQMRKHVSQDIGAIYGDNEADDQLIYRLQDNYRELMIQCARMRPEYVGVVVDMIKKMIDSPQEVTDFLNLEIYHT